jgi:AcrR family transcriptional regulator
MKLAALARGYNPREPKGAAGGDAGRQFDPKSLRCSRGWRAAGREMAVKRESVNKQPAGRREQKKAETTKRIALAGRKLIRAKGFDAVTTQEVAIEAGIPPGTLFGYISGKTDLLIIALVHEAMEFVATIKPRIPATGPFKDRVMFVFEEMAEYHGRDIEITRHFLRELAITLNPELTERSHGLGDAVREVVASVVAEHQKLGEVTRELEAADISRFLFSHYWSSLRYWVTGILTREEFTSTLRKALKWQFAGIAARPEPAGK